MFWGSNIAEIIDILNLIRDVRRVAYRTSLFSLPFANDEQIPRLIRVGCGEKAS
jgi:hypothetical protein